MECSEKSKGQLILPCLILGLSQVEEQYYGLIEEQHCFTTDEGHKICCSKDPNTGARECHSGQYNIRIPAWQRFSESLKKLACSTESCTMFAMKYNSNRFSAPCANLDV